MHHPRKIFWTACIASVLFSVSACACKGPVQAESPDVDKTRPSESASGLTGAGCMRTGCSGHLCAPEGEPVMSTCIYKEEYACYRTAKCEKQSSGACGWTPSKELQSCLKAAGEK